MVPKEVVLAIWQEYSGIRLADKHKKLFCEQCAELTKFNYRTLYIVFERCREPGDFKLVSLVERAKTIKPSKRLTLDYPKSQKAIEKRPHVKPNRAQRQRNNSDKYGNYADGDYWQKWTDPKPLHDTKLHKRIAQREKQALKSSKMFRKENYPF